MAYSRQQGPLPDASQPPTVVGVSGDDHRFRVLAWVSERRFVLYVPAIEAATTPESAIHCDIEVGRVPGGPPSLR